jgi:hypothetical protein
MFAGQRVITTEAFATDFVYAADVDGDGDIDVFTASRDDGNIAWYENTDGRGTFGTLQVITTLAVDAQSVYVADVDGDGDADVLSTASNGIAWYENTDGLGTFGNERVITSAAGIVRSAHAVDGDGDGDVDVLSASFSYGNGLIAWYENTDGKGTFGSQRVINILASARSVYAADVDGDGDVDIISASSTYDRFGENGKISWYENKDGKGTFRNAEGITTAATGAGSVFAADLDGDSDVDVLSASNGRIAWYEQRLAGDSNDDGVFNSSDLVRVIQSGEYEDGVPRNTTFDEGDWNGDQEFDSSDLVLAFQFGHYEAANPAAAIINAAPIDWLFANDKDRRKPHAIVEHPLFAILK